MPARRSIVTRSNWLSNIFADIIIRLYSGKSEVVPLESISSSRDQNIIIGTTNRSASNMCRPTPQQGHQPFIAGNESGLIPSRKVRLALSKEWN
jgi:hypothetical protein